MSSSDGKKTIYRGKIWKARMTYIKISGYSGSIPASGDHI
jgi:hypothetical protein